MSPYKYFERSKNEWDDYHRTLMPKVKPKDYAPYPFSDLLNVIAEESPELMADMPAVPITPQSNEILPQAGVPVLAVNDVLSIAKEVIGSSDIDADTPLLEAGLDSLGATALGQSVQAAVGSGVEVPAILVFEYPTARQITSSLMSAMPALP
eukprot:4388306-Prymnesium_polylepis.1